MEESLNIKDFNAKNWLKMSLELTRPESIEVQLSELSFNLNICKTQLEESIKLISSDLSKNEPKIKSSLSEMTKNFKEINNFFKKQDPIKTELKQMSINQNLYDEINEMNLIKTRINDTLFLMDLFIGYEFNVEETLIFLEEKNLKELENKINDMQILIQIILKLHPLDSKREKIENLIERIKEFLKLKLEEIFDKDKEKMNIDICSSYQILKKLKNEQLFIDIYKKNRLNLIFVNFQESSKLQNDDIIHIVDLFFNYFKKEIDYFSELLNNKLSELMSEILKELIENLLKYINDIYLKNFNQKHNIEYLSSYLKITKFIYLQIDTGLIIRKIDIKSIENTLFSLFQVILKSFITKEKLNLEKQIIKKIRNNNEILEKDYNYEDKINEFSFLKISEILDNSFLHMNEFTAGTETEEWIIMVQSLTQEIFQKFERIIEELDSKQFSHKILDNLIVFERNSNKIECFNFEKMNLNEKKTKNINLRENLSLVEVLIDKYEEFSFFNNLIVKLDKKIRISILENKTSFYKEIYIKIQEYLLQNNENLKKKKEGLMISLKNGILIFDNIFNGINSIQQKMKKIIIKLFLSDSYNKIIELGNINIWFFKEKKENIFNSNKPSDDIILICQNFFSHKQMFEEIKKSMIQNSTVSHFLDNYTNNNEKEDIFENIYLNKLNSEVYLYENFEGMVQKIKEEGEKIDLVKFWGIVYSFFLIKIFCFVFKNINEINDLGKEQLKIDLEYINDILVDLKYSAGKKILEDLKYILNNKKIDHFKNYDFGVFNL